MISNTDLTEILFLDIETVPAFRTLAEVPEALREIWIDSHGSKKKRKAKSKSQAATEELTDEDGEPTAIVDSNYGDAGLHAEFGRVICISLGRFEGGDKDENFKVHSLFSHNEIEILNQFSAVLNKYKNFKLCAHNGKGFDFPFLGKRFLINGLQLPPQLDIMGMKPWEVPHLDTMELWGFGQRGMGGGVKLKLLCAVFGIESPKGDIDGGMVRGVYYGEDGGKGLERIVEYCERDVVALGRVYRRVRG